MQSSTAMFVLGRGGEWCDRSKILELKLRPIYSAKDQGR